jgi:hypothetical protein
LTPERRHVTAARTAAAAAQDGYALAAFAFSGSATLPGSADNLPR